jgi:hypothetical protein
MGILPATGTEIAIGKVWKAMTNINPTSGLNLGLNSTLGFNRQPPQVSGTTTQQTRIENGVQTKLSEDFGGLTTPHDYTP